MYWIIERLQKHALSVLNMDIYQALRLVIIIGGYIFIRTRAQEWLKVRQLRQQSHMEGSSSNNNNKSDDDLLPEEDQDQQKKDSANWGWGKQTRRKVAIQGNNYTSAVERIAQMATDESKFEEIEHEQVGFQPESDADIADLLED
ncbi:Pga2 protein [Martiniozyma asiatica (nom. inval.)]|nr:Pga2 protein [Martiniozyma asiatica]